MSTTNPSWGDVVKPPTYLVWAIISLTLLCALTGLPAMVHATKVDAAYNRGDYDAAHYHSRRARIWVGASVVAAILSLLAAALALNSVF